MIHYVLPKTHLAYTLTDGSLAYELAWDGGGLLTSKGIILLWVKICYVFALFRTQLRPSSPRLQICAGMSIYYETYFVFIVCAKNSILYAGSKDKLPILFDIQSRLVSKTLCLMFKVIAVKANHVTFLSKCSNNQVLVDAVLMHPKVRHLVLGIVQPNSHWAKVSRVSAWLILLRNSFFPSLMRQAPQFRVLYFAIFEHFCQKQVDVASIRFPMSYGQTSASS